MNDNTMQVQEKPAEPTALKNECGPAEPAKEPPCTGMLPAPLPPGPAGKFLGKPATSLPHFSGMLTSGSGRDTQTLLMSSGGMRPSAERDDYLLRLLGKGSRPAAPSSVPGPSSGFRVPDPVPPRTAQAAAPNPAAPVGAAGPEKASAPSVLPAPGVGNANTASGQPVSEVAPGWSYADTRRRMGAAPAAALRATVVGHQVAFLEQLYDLHRAIAVQKLLVRTCPEVKPLMAEAARILISASSGQRDALAAPPAKRRRVGETPLAAVPGGPTPMATDALPASGGEEEPELRPDSQFAAVPLPGETAATGDGSGDDGDGSGPNGSGGGGSGGGSNSPQPGVPVAVAPPMPPRRLALLQPAPSGASQTPMAFPRAPMMAAAAPWGAYPPMGAAMTPQAAMQMHMQMQMQMAGAPAMAYPPAAANAAAEGAVPFSYPNNAGYMGYPTQAGPSAPAGAPGAGSAGAGQPGAGAAAPAPVGPASAGVAAAGGDPMAWWYHNYYGRQQMAQAQAAAAAAVAAQAMPPPAPAPAQALGGAVPSARWWHDCNATFGPAADPAVVAAACKAAAGEAESAPPSAAGPCSGLAAQGSGPAKKAASLPPLPPRRPKRKPSDPIEEASSGTTGQDHHLGPHAVADDAHFKSRSPRPASTAGKKVASAAAAASPPAADTTAARLLLSMSGKAAV